MKDFVTRLLDATPRAPLRPVIRSVFEPAPPLPIDEPVPERSLDETPPVPDRASVERGEAPTEAPARAASAAPDEPPAGPSPGATIPVPPAITSPQAHPVSRTAILAAEQPASMSSRPRSGEPRPTPTASHLVRATDAAVPPGPVTASERIAVGHPVRPQTTNAAAPAPTENVVGPTILSPPADQSVHVTIGRVDVRVPPAAPAPSPAAQRSPKRAPVQSLTDYLTSRAGGAR